MERGERHGLVAGLRDEDRADAERLLERCNRHEGLDLPLALDPALSAGDAATQFCSYDRGELIGVAWLPPDESAPEACLLVHPDHRRRGVGRTLLDAARAECRRRGLSRFLLVCDEASPSGKAFAAAVGGRYRSSEYRLELDRTAVDRARPRIAALRLRPAGADDAAILARLLAASFGEPEGAARDQTERMLRDPTRRHYLGVLGDEPIGLLRLGAYEGYADVTAFGVVPAHRGRGYGRQLLGDAVDVLLAEGRRRIVIEVATDNVGALGLYRACGFRVASAYGFYELAP